MNINAFQNYNLRDNNCSNTSFTSLNIKVKGAEFKKNPIDGQRIIEAIENNVGIKNFFSNHNGKITITSGTINVPVTHEYPDCLKKVPTRSLPIDQFTVDETSYCINIKCRYKRPFALKYLFKKPVLVKAGIKNEKEVLSWDTCVGYTLRLINEKLADAINGCEQRRLKVEKP